MLLAILKRTTFAAYTIQSSSIAGSPGCQDLIPAPTIYETTNSTIADLQSDRETRHGFTEQARFFCSHPDCQDVSFGREKELNRHRLKHDDQYPRWQCGCCLKLGRTFIYERKDKLQSHLRTHASPKPKRSIPGICCPDVNCRTLFTAAPCLEEHLREEHPDCAGVRNLQSQVSNGE